MPKPSENFVRVQVRLSPEVWQKMEWLADEQGCSRADLTRRILAAATKGVTKPTRPNTLTILASDRERANWAKAAETLEVTLSDLVKQTLNRVANRIHPPPDTGANSTNETSPGE